MRIVIPPLLAAALQKDAAEHLRTPTAHLEWLLRAHYGHSNVNAEPLTAPVVAKEVPQPTAQEPQPVTRGSFPWRHDPLVDDPLPEPSERGKRDRAKSTNGR